MIPVMAANEKLPNKLCVNGGINSQINESTMTNSQNDNKGKPEKDFTPRNITNWVCTRRAITTLTAASHKALFVNGRNGLFCSKNIFSVDKIMR